MSLLGGLTYFLRLQIQQNEGGIFLSQTKYLKHILKKYGMEDEKPVCTRMVTGCSLSANDESVVVHQPTYRSMIGSDPGGCWWPPPIPFGPPQLSLSAFSVSLIVAQLTIFSSFSGPELPEPF